MHATEGASAEAAAWFVEPDHVIVNPRARKGLRGRRDDDGPTSVRAVSTAALFLVLLATTLLVGGHAAVAPLLSSAMAARDAKAMGDVIYAMPDGIFCRHMSFDNATAAMIEGAVEACPDGIARGRTNAARNFAWGGR